jgi:hypothetical protein
MKQFVDINGYPTNLVTTAENEAKEIAKGNVEVPLCTETFYRKKWDFQNDVWIEGATPEEIASHQAEILKQKETDLYIKRMQDAQRIWAGLSAEFRIAKQVGQMDDATENIILAELKPVLDIVVPFGQWVTGYQLLLGIGSSVIGQPLYDKIHNILWSYIQENYEEMEVEQLKQSINKK